MRMLHALALLWVCMLPVTHTARAEKLSPHNLRCESLVAPLGLDESHPRLSWIVASTARGEKQTAYRILAASSEEALRSDRGDLWDSGRVNSDQTSHIPYAGAPLESNQRVWWKVRVWDAAGNVSGWSEPTTWEMAFLSPSDWQGRWIARDTNTAPQPLPLLRRAFTLDAKSAIKRARIYVSGLGYFELSLNGRRVGDHLLAPGYTRYDRRVLYETHDVTALLQTGANALGAMLGNGWFNVQTAAAWDFDAAPWRASPRLRLDLRIEYADGRIETIATDERWKTAAGPIVFNTIYGGETYDARRELPGWDSPDFDDSGWQSAEVVDAPAGRLVAQTMPPIRATHVIAPVAVTELKPGVFIVDAGRNVAGVAQISVSGPAGTTVQMKYSERLAPDGSIERTSIGAHVWSKGKDQAFQTDTFILKDSGERQTWHSRFVYHGFRYIEITGAPAPIATDDVRIRIVHTDLAETARFESSNPVVNRIWQNTRASYLGNLHGIFTDCPHREKNGWTGDAHLAAEFGLLSHDGSTVYEKWIDDIGDEQRPSGELPGIVPTAGWGYAWGNGPAWDSAYLLIPHYLHLYTGNTRLRLKHYEGHRRYVDYLTTKAEAGIVSIGLGDWVPWKTATPEAVTSTAYYYVDALIVAESARLLGRDEDEKKYRALAADIRRAFNSKFFDPATGLYANGSQTALSCALYQGLVGAADRERVSANLQSAVARADDHIDTGILGAKYLLNTLTEIGQADLGYRIVTQKTAPSWGNWIERGATTLWEQWDGGASQNHIMFGDVAAWFVKTLAGINPDPAAPGFKHVIIAPQPVGDLTFVKASHDSVRGRIGSAWTIADGEFRLDVSIPANCTATVVLPTADAASIRESGRPLDSAPHVVLRGVENGRTLVEIGSGDYAFAVKHRSESAPK